jgi:GNAT superfamily N-acetyltransferase
MDSAQFDVQDLTQFSRSRAEFSATAEVAERPLDGHDCQLSGGAVPGLPCVRLPGGQVRRTSHSHMTLRPGTPRDAEAIADLIATFQSELTDHPDGVGAERYLASVSSQAERGYLESDRYRYIVAEREGALLGFIAIRDVSHIFHLFVARPHHREGIARRLWQEAKTLALRDVGLEKFTVNSSLRAVQVYRSFGFHELGAIVSANGISIISMRLNVKIAAS